ncbi:MAG: IgGFc-binding protein [Myxococcales bacterium]|nr:IgGFc-binding protein [Myxococcales bacterium]
MRRIRLTPAAPLIAALLLACTADDVAGTDTATSGVSASASATMTASTSGSASASTSNGTSDGSSGGSGSESSASGTTSGGTDSTGTTSASGTTSGSTSVAETDSSTGSSTTGELCPEGTILCENGEAKTCDGMGGYSDTEVCSDECADGIGCVLCVPDSFKCEGEESLKCNAQGDALEPYETCDGLQGLSCDENSGTCFGPCGKEALGLNYIGCDYFPTLTPQYPGYQTNPHVFAVAVSNTSGAMAKITVTRGANMVTTDMVAPGTVKTITLPWDNVLTEMNGTTKLIAEGAYRLRSDQPVTVYQYNPLAATVTNDASLLLPRNAWTGNYLVASWQHWDQVARPGFYAVIAAEADTTVTLQPSATGNKVSAGAGVNADGTGVAMLQPSDVLMVRSATGGDMTGTIVTADRPVQVIAGHPCTNVPLDKGACDHLEESMFPLDTLAKDYIVVPPAQVPDDTKEKAQMVRFIASEDATTLTFEPDQAFPKALNKAGDFIEVSTTVAAFRVTSDKKIAVAQYMVGQSAGYGTSDPAMLMSVATDQFRKTYLFHAPPTWSANYVDIIAPTGASLMVDNMAVPGALKPIGNSGFGYIHVKLSNAGDGTHTVSSDQEVGISVYGVLNYGSYWYAGGLDLMPIPQ